MAPLSLHRQFFETSRGRIVNALRRGPATAEELGSSIGQTASAIRAQLRSMGTDGLVEQAGFRAGTTRPFVVYRLTAEVEQLLSHAYVPFLSRLVDVFVSRQQPTEFASVVREAGRGLAEDLNCRSDASRPFAERLAAASQLLNEQLGAVTHVEQDGETLAIKSDGCPLAAITGKQPAACLAIQSLLEECLRVPLQECCDRTERPRCCFRISPADAPLRV